MKKESVFYSPKIHYEVISHGKLYGINVYFEGHSESEDPNLRSFIPNFSENIATAENFIRSISEYAALPIHVPELAEDFLLYCNL